MRLFRTAEMNRGWHDSHSGTTESLGPQALGHQALGPQALGPQWLGTPLRRAAVECLVMALIIVVGVSSRLWLQELPNFKPVAALALFAGFYFRRVWQAMFAAFAILLLSDFWIGTYDWRLAISVYASFGLAALLGVWVGQIFRSAGRAQGEPERLVSPQRSLGAKHWLQLGLASLAMSTLFYLLTNGAVWVIGGWYSGDVAGLIQCYAAAIPFYRATLAGDLMFTGAVFGVYQAVLILQASRCPQPAAGCQLAQ